MQPETRAVDPVSRLEGPWRWVYEIGMGLLAVVVEFFFAAPSEVRDVLAKKVGSLLEFTETAEATEYLQSVRYWPARDSGVSAAG